MPNLVKSPPVQVTDFIAGLNLGPRDELKLIVRAGVATAHVKRSNGQVHSATTMLNGKLKRMVAVDAAELTRSERRKMVRQLSKEGHRQTAIANLLGISQGTVSLDLQ